MMDKFCTYLHVQNIIVPNSNQQTRSLLQLPPDALMTAHAGPLDMVEPYLWTSGGWLRRGRKSTWASLATQSRLGSALRAASSVVWSMAFLGKQQHKITKNNHHQVAICYAKCAFCNLSNNTFNATVAQLMRRADCHHSS